MKMQCTLEVSEVTRTSDSLRLLRLSCSGKHIWNVRETVSWNKHQKLTSCPKFVLGLCERSLLISYKLKMSRTRRKQLNRVELNMTLAPSFSNVKETNLFALYLPLPPRRRPTLIAASRKVINLHAHPIRRIDTVSILKRFATSVDNLGETTLNNY